jgi:putative transposase
MNQLDRLHLEQPWLGARKLAILLSQPEQPVNRKRIKRLMRKMGLECLFCRPKRQQISREHRKYPNLVKGEIINRPCVVWSADITYIPMSNGFMYLAAVIDWYSRLVVSWQLSNSLDSLFCERMLEASLQQGQPKIYHTDQGVQFTSEGWIRRVESANILVSMTHSGRYQENLFIERLWRSLKYENIYPNHYSSVYELEAGIAEYIRYYNEVRPHQALEYLTPRQVHESAGIRV